MIKRQSSNLTLYCLDKYENELVEYFQLIHSPSDFMKQGGTCTVFANQNTVIKRYNQPSLLHRFKQNIKLGRAKNTYQITKQLFDAGINISEPIAYGFQSTGFLRTAEYFLAKRLDGITLLAMLENTEITIQEKEKIIIKAIQLIELLWAKGWTHGDLKLPNLMLVDNEVYFIDMDGTKPLTKKRLIKDKHRFLKNFTQPSLHDVVKRRLEI